MPLPFLEFATTSLTTELAWGTSGWVAIGLSYLLGAVPFGLVLVWFATHQDLREFGSGNIGATNAMRAAGKPVGIVSFLLDWAKGLVPVLVIAPWAGGGDLSNLVPLQVACGSAAVLGHCFPIYLKLRGGKGVATACGALAALDPMLLVVGFVAWIVTLLVSRYVGLASIAMGLAFPLAAWWRRGPEDGSEVLVGSCLLTLLILVRHRSNMARMLAGTEPKAGAKKDAAGEQS